MKDRPESNFGLWLTFAGFILCVTGIVCLTILLTEPIPEEVIVPARLLPIPDPVASEKAIDEN